MEEVFVAERASNKREREDGDDAEDEELFLMFSDGVVVSEPKRALLNASQTLRAMAEDVDLSQNSRDNALPLPHISSAVWAFVGPLLPLAVAEVEVALLAAALPVLLDVVKALSFLDMNGLNTLVIDFIGRRGEQAVKMLTPEMVAGLPEDCRFALVMRVLEERNGPLHESCEAPSTGVAALNGDRFVAAHVVAEDKVVIAVQTTGSDGDKVVEIRFYHLPDFVVASRHTVHSAGLFVRKIASAGGRVAILLSSNDVWVLDAVSFDVLFCFAWQDDNPAKLHGHVDLCIARDGSWIARISNDRLVQICDVRSGHCLMSVPLIRPEYDHSAIRSYSSPDSRLLHVFFGRTLITFSVPEARALYDVDSGHSNCVRPDGQIVVWHRSLCLFRPDSGVCYKEVGVSSPFMLSLVWWVKALFSFHFAFSFDCSCSCADYLLASSDNKIMAFDWHGKLRYTRDIPRYGISGHSPDRMCYCGVVSASGSVVVVCDGYASLIPAPFQTFRSKLRAHQTKKLWLYLKQSYKLRSQRLRVRAWEHCLELVNNAEAPVQPPGVQVYDPSRSASRKVK